MGSIMKAQYCVTWLEEMLWAIAEFGSLFTWNSDAEVSLLMHANGS
jgi:hypothetical protein